MKAVFRNALAMVVLAVFLVGPLWGDDPQGKIVRSDNWLGLMCYPPPAVLRAQLNLPKGQGLVVAEVVADGPAAKAGIKENDVLLTAGDKSLTDLPTLTRLVADTGAKQIKIKLLRGGKEQTVSATPAERPAEPPRGWVFPGQDRAALRQWLEQFDEDKLAPGQLRPKLRLRFLRPGVILGEGEVRAAWPGDLSVNVTREGDKPVQIKIKKGDKEWDVSSEELGNLPATLLPFVEQMLGGGGGAVAPPAEAEIDAKLPEISLPEVTVPEPGEATEESNSTPPRPQPDTEAKPVEKEDVQRRLEEINRRLKKLQDELRTLEDE